MKQNQSFLIKIILAILGVVAALLLLIGGGLSLLFSFNRSDVINEKQTTDEEVIRKEDDQREITFINSNNNEVKITAEIANTPSERARGLMDRTFLEYDRGMLFVFDDDISRSFWMKNTYISLDIIFVDKNKRIIKIHRNTKPLDTTILYPSDSPAMYAIEVNGGWTELNNVNEGNKIYF